MEFITLRTFQNYFQAHILLTKLQDAGLACFLKDELTVTMDPIISNAIGGIKLVVSSEDLPKAIELIKQYDQQYREHFVCPQCHGKNIVLVPKQTASNLFVALLTWTLGSYAISSKNIYRCADCGYECSDMPEDEDETEAGNDEHVNLH